MALAVFYAYFGIIMQKNLNSRLDKICKEDPSSTDL